MPWWVIPAAILGQVWPLLVFIGGLALAAWIWAFTSGDYVIVGLFGGLLTVVVLGVVGSFVMHESAHVVALRPAAGVSHIAIHRTWLRVSIVPVGDLTAQHAAVAAVAGPLSCVLAGGLGWLLGLTPAVYWCYLAHGVFLLPVFGDGRTLVRCLVHLRRVQSAAGHPPADEVGGA